MKEWPKAGSKVIYNGTKPFWFTNIVKDAEDNLEVGKQYTVLRIELASSWCAVILEEFQDFKFSLSFFSYNKELTTQQAMSIEKIYTQAAITEAKTEELHHTLQIFKSLKYLEHLYKKGVIHETVAYKNDVGTYLVEFQERIDILHKLLDIHPSTK